MKSKKILTTLLLTALYAGTLPAQADELPGYFDWRREVTTDRNSAFTNSIVPAVREQGKHETCWTFGALASFESNWNLQLWRAGITNTAAPDFSERYIAWLAYAESLDGNAATKIHCDVGSGMSRIYTKAPELIYDQGGNVYRALSTLLSYGAVLESAVPYSRGTDMQGVAQLVTPSGLIHDVYGMLYPMSEDTRPMNWINAAIPYYKKMLQQQGVLIANYWVTRGTETMKDILNLESTSLNHCIALVGWDDDYVITKNGKTYKGAWIMRNSWGTNSGENGYFYISYADTSLQTAASAQPELDSARYTTLSTWAPLGPINDIELGDSTVSFANRLPSSASQFVKAVGMYVPRDGMQYTVSIRLRGTSPTDGTAVYTQSGTFGKNGSAAYEGYRTIDLDKFVYLPKSENYVVQVSLTDKDGKPVALMVTQAVAGVMSAITVPTGVSYVYTNGAWEDTAAGSGTPQSVIINGLGKNSEQANGGDFTVVSLDDAGAGGSTIYLGQKNELYKTDALHPNRTTLSNMTVELTKGVTDSWYGGVISGEGAVTKTGDGVLALSGANTYTGVTTVSAGELTVTQGLQNSVTVASGAGFSGNGTIHGDLTSNGTLTTGLTPAAASLMGKSGTDTVGTLAVTGNLNASALQVAVQGASTSRITVGGTTTLTNATLALTDGSTPIVNQTYTYLTSTGAITNDVTVPKPALSAYVELTAAKKDNTLTYTAVRNSQTLQSNVSGLSPAETAVLTAMDARISSASKSGLSTAGQQNLSRTLYEDAAAIRKTAKENTAEPRAQLLSQSPLTSLTSEALASRLETIGVDTTAGAAGGSGPAAAAPVTLDDGDHLWIKLFQGFETYNGSNDLKDHSFGGTLGYDKPVDASTRIGGLLSYAMTSYSTANIDGNSHDWRIGAYIEHRSGAWDYSGLLSYGRNHYDLDRYVSQDGSKLNANYQARIWSLEAKAKYLVPSTRCRTWQVAPYGKLSYSHTSQDAYTESGSDAWAQQLKAASHSSVSGEIGVGFTRRLDLNSSYGLTFGYRRVLSGADTTLNGSFAGEDSHPFAIRSQNDRNFFTYSLNLHGTLGGRWTGQAEFWGEVSPNTHKEVLSLAAKYSF